MLALADASPAQGRLPPHVLGGSPHALEDAVCREQRGVARPPVLGRAPRGPPGLLSDDVHVGDVGAHVAGRDVTPTQGLDEPAVGPQQLGCLVGGGVADDHRLAAAVVQTGERVLARHGAREPQHVGQGEVHAGVGVEAGAPEARAQGRVVQGDDRAQPGVGIGAEHDLLVSAEVDEVGCHVSTLARDQPADPLLARPTTRLIVVATITVPKT